MTRIAAAVAIATLGLFLPAALSDPPKPAPAAVAAADAQVPPKKDAKPLALKVFRLARAEPNDVQNALTDLLGDQDHIDYNLGLDGKPLPQAAQNLGFCGLGLGGGNGGLGIGGGFGGGGATPLWRSTTDDRVKLVAVRGGEKHLKLAAAVVAVLDRKPGAPLPATTELKAFELVNADAAGVVQMIEDLFGEDVKRHATAKLVMAAGSESDLAAVAELVAACDVPEKPAADK